MAESTSSQVVPGPPAAGTPDSSGGEPGLIAKVLRVAWLAIVLGIFFEVLLLVFVAYLGAAGSTPKPFVADLAQKVSWSVIVCVGIAFGTAAGRARPAAMGVLGLISAPVGFVVARSFHKGVLQALDVAGPAVAGASPFLIGALKGLEYGALGTVIGWIGKRAWGGLGAHAAAGVAIGLTFGGAILAVMIGSAAVPLPTADLTSQAINELLFPLGCSLVLYSTGILGKRFGA
jgi:hypothetical protein